MSRVAYLLDTNVVSELSRREPEPRVLSWFAGVSDAQLRLSVLTVGEIRRGVERLPDPLGRRRLQLWLDEQLLPWLGSRLLPIDLEVADHWGQLGARAYLAGGRQSARGDRAGAWLDAGDAKRRGLRFSGPAMHQSVGSGVTRLLSTDRRELGSLTRRSVIWPRRNSRQTVMDPRVGHSTQNRARST